MSIFVFQINIDECATQPCHNNASCSDGINDYTCQCFPGYGGKNCDQDIAECLERPCNNDGLCFERSNATLYLPEVARELPFDVRQTFLQEFDYSRASGYICSCLPGFDGECGPL